MRKAAIIFIIILFGTGSVLAFGISSPYHKNKPLEMTAGEIKEISFNLQNCPSLKDFCNEGEVDVIISGFEEGGEIAEVISGSGYRLPFGSYDENIVLKISIPESAYVGEKFNVKLTVSSIPNEEKEGNVQLGVKYGINFPVNIIQEPEKSPEAKPETLIEEIKGKSSKRITIAIVVLIASTLLLFVLLLVLRNVSRETKQEKVEFI